MRVNTKRLMRVNTKRLMRVNINKRTICLMRMHKLQAVNVRAHKHQMAHEYNIAVLRTGLACNWPRTSTNEPRHEISNNVVCATSKGSNQPAHTRSLIRAFASRLNILWPLSADRTSFGVSKLKMKLHGLVWVYSCQNATLLKISYTTLTNISTKYLVMCKVYTDVGGIK